VRLRRVLLALLPLVLLGVAAWVLHRELAGFRFRDVSRTFGTLPPYAVFAAIAVTALNYLCLTFYDVLALAHLKKKVPYPEVGFASFIGYAFGHNLGFAALSGGSVRLRLYSDRGLSAVDVAQIAVFNGLTFWLGFVATSALALLLGPDIPGVSLSPLAARGIGIGAALLVAGYLVACARVRRELTIRDFRIALPTLRLGIGQLVVSVVDWVLAALVLHLLIPPGVGPSLVGLVLLFLFAQIAGLVSQVPGGIGVFESVMVTALSPAVPAATTLGLLVVYRIVYYLLPFLFAALLLAGSEVLRRRHHLFRLVKVAHASFAPVVPWVAAVGALVAGGVLLASGATPTMQARLSWLEHLLPLGILELSHLLASVAGVGLVLLARGLQLRIDAAWVLSMGLLVGGVIFSLVKGLDYEEASLLLAIALALAPFRSQFYRKASLLNAPFTARWIGAIALVIGASIWLGFFSYRHVEYAGSLWWQFAFKADAPRFLRASFAVVTLASLFGLTKLLGPAQHVPPLPGPSELGKARPILASSDSSAHLALLGDKALLFNEASTAFLMYAVEGRSWVSMGDPVGADKDATELAWRFRAMSDQHRGWTCFYQVGPEHLPRYLDLGLALLKLGEEATVPLEGFTLETPDHRAIRTSHRKVAREGVSFEVIPPSQVAPLLPELKEISDQWLSAKNTREKGFSLGFFDERYLQETPMALARREGKVVAFANMWTSEAKVELSVDLMRYRDDAPPGVMEYLFAELMQWGRDQGYREFNLGMAPFSGFEERAHSPLWNRVGAFLFLHGEHFYNFQGLRQYKEKFKPAWRPRYLASPGGLVLPYVLSNIAALVSRGLTGVVKR